MGTYFKSPPTNEVNVPEYRINRRLTSELI
jgi:hypothetical protein